MSSSYSLDLRVRVVAKYDEGFTYDDVAEMFSVHPRTVRRWVKLRDAEGHLD
ncbi:MAG: helix-turn-helix domain-containing protein, partial [Candidatus Sericytochromatia bacterium]